MEPLLIDFGIATINDQSRTGQGTVRFKAPELFARYSKASEGLRLENAAGQNTEATDAWAFGMTVYVLIHVHLIYAILLTSRAGIAITRTPIL